VDLLAVAERDHALVGADGREQPVPEVGVRLLRAQAAEEVGDVARVQAAGRDLVHQRLEHVVDVAVHQRDVDVGVPQRPHRGDAGEAAADDDDVGAGGAVVGGAVDGHDGAPAGCSVRGGGRR
jgi:hypothetical protein